MGKRLAGAALLLVLALQVSCHKSGAAAAVTVVMSPTSASLNVQMFNAFFASVTGGTNNTVNWAINGIASNSQPAGNPYGSLTIGVPTINALGQEVTEAIYTAPASVPSGTTVTITAISTDNPSVTSSSTVTILVAATVTVSPAGPTALAAAMQQQFSATVIPAPSPTVIWEVNGLPGGSANFGTISNTGLYIAPLSPPPGGSVTVTAVSVADTAQQGSSTVTLTFGTASLQGPYAFTLTGRNASGSFWRAGSFTADGTGGLVGGLEDATNASGTTSSCGSHASFSFTGTYTVTPDGRGTLQFSDGLSPSQFRIAMASHNQVELISFDTSSPPNGTAQGEADLQNLAAFKASAFQGAYLFDFSGQDSGGGPISIVGEFQADGNGGLHNGLEDVNDDGTISSQVSFTGSYCVTANGRGTAQFVTTNGTFNYSFYIVSSGSAKFVSLDGSPAPEVAGTLRQPMPGAVFSESSLSGNYAFLIAGANSRGNIATVGSFAAGGNDLLTGGVLDENAAGTVTPNASFTGTYSVNTTGTGRGTATLNATNRTYQMVFYLDGYGGGFFQETDSGAVSDGVLAQQTSTPSLSGSWALQAGGAAGGTTRQFAGQFLLSTGNTVTSGTLDSSSYPGTVAGTSLALTGGTLTAGSGARDTLSLTSSSATENFVVYVVTPTEMFALETDSGTLTDGLLLKQY